MGIAALVSVLLWVAWYLSPALIPESGRARTLALTVRGGLFGVAVALTLAILLTLTTTPRNPFFFRAVALGMCLLGLPFGCVGSLASNLNRTR